MNTHGANLDLKESKKTVLDNTPLISRRDSVEDIVNFEFKFNPKNEFLTHDHMTVSNKFLRSGKLKATVTEIKNINLNTRHQMWSLYSDYYEGATWESFNSDMDEKTHIVVARDSGDSTLQGFSTIKMFEHNINGTKTITLYSGDTVIHPKYWGQKALHFAFFKFLVKTRFTNPFTKVFWFLLCNGYRTYLVFSRNIPNHWPRYDKETPPWEKNFIHSLSIQRFGSQYDAEKGVVKFISSLGKLKPNVAPIGEKELKEPAIRFLVEKNPGYINGDELCCLGEINFSLFLLFPLRTVKKIFKSFFKKQVLPKAISKPVRPNL